MSVPVFMSDPATGHCALFDEAPGGGAFDDASSLRNRPLADPANWLPNIHFHTLLDRLEVLSDATVAVTHALVNTASATGYADANTPSAWFAYSNDRLLATHGLGYVPDFMVAQGANIIWPGFPVQGSSFNGVGRFVSVYATTTEIRMFEWASVTAAISLPAVSLNYEVLIFEQMPDPAPGAAFFEYDEVSDTVRMDFDRFDSGRRYLQVVAGGSPFGMAKGRTIDLANGAPRYVRPDGTVFEPVQTGLKMRLTTDGTFGNAMNYNGAFAGSAVAQVQAP